MDLSAINDELASYSVVLKFALEVHESASRYRLKLELAQAETVGSHAIAVTFENVARLSVSDLGGGLTQFLCFKVLDIRDRQWDGINFEVRELERESVTFACESVGQIARYRVGD